jgi:hypothetical protein
MPVTTGSLTIPGGSLKAEGLGDGGIISQRVSGYKQTSPKLRLRPPR